MQGKDLGSLLVTRERIGWSVMLLPLRGCYSPAMKIPWGNLSFEMRESIKWKERFEGTYSLKIWFLFGGVVMQ